MLKNKSLIFTEAICFKQQKESYSLVCIILEAAENQAIKNLQISERIFGLCEPMEKINSR